MAELHNLYIHPVGTNLSRAQDIEDHAFDISEVAGAMPSCCESCFYRPDGYRAGKLDPFLHPENQITEKLVSMIGRSPHRCHSHDELLCCGSVQYSAMVSTDDLMEHIRRFQVQRKERIEQYLEGNR